MEQPGRQLPVESRSCQISVVIPVKDDAKELALCLAALGQQTRRPDEVIVVDNDSTDDSATVAAVWGATVLTCTDPGIPAASSHGYDHATGDLILRLDADCVPPDTWVADVERAFARDSALGAVTGPARFHDGPRLLRAPLAAAYLAAYTAAGVLALGHRPLFGSNLAMRRAVWETVAPSIERGDPELHDDFALSYRVGECFRIGRLRADPMGISMRPFGSLSSLRRRGRRGFHTVKAQWPEDFPPYRWRKLVSRPVKGG
ncbi:glycosyltransferase family A protein [Nesterenkonia flava]|uniref:4,4'-diaponeurosporenoate glycosyltransferase n=1 Tax=Nesterenkonia flava TaxID=469799 RepID=A0ABU1FTN2_9MICC|nr:glycosyltransferase family A protein [Nesterenkonia flava]MDR5711506.1 glycosyltransferase family A protein [Nesterenkonia flava]